MIRILTIGKLKISWAKSACEDYQRRLRRFGGVDVVEIADSNPLAESRIMQQKLRGGPSVACDCRGQVWTSEEVSEFLGQHGSPSFLIGGPEGLHPDLIRECEHRIAFGAITLPHELARVVLLEQIYRAMTILRGHPYHR